MMDDPMRFLRYDVLWFGVVTPYRRGAWGFDDATLVVGLHSRSGRDLLGNLPALQSILDAGPAAGCVQQV
jgi:hypothetical protein